MISGVTLWGTQWQRPQVSSQCRGIRNTRRCMMYMIRNTWRAQRGKAPAIIEAVKMVNQAITAQAGFSNGKIYADMSGPFDTVIWQFEAESLDRFYQVERGVFVNPDAATQR